MKQDIVVWELTLLLFSDENLTVVGSIKVIEISPFYCTKQE